MSLKAGGKRLKRVRMEAVQRFFEEFVSGLEHQRRRPIWFLQASQGDGFREEEIVQLLIHQGRRGNFSS